jgi:hypothetical protein
MKSDRQYFDIYPLVFSGSKSSKITIKPLFKHVDFSRAKQVRIEYVPVDGLMPDGSWLKLGEAMDIDFVFENGALVIEQFLAGEQEHNFKIFDTDGDNKKLLLEFTVYSLEDDLRQLRPFKGDFHMHSYCSDGKESPAYVAASCRKIGFDFMALTDHREYTPSLEAKEFIDSLPTDFKCYPGEEVHAPDNNVHIVNFGGSFSVNEMYRQDEEAYREAVRNIVSELPEEVPEAVKFPLASSEWCFDRIREGGGIAMYCHPYWRWVGRNYISEALNDWMFERGKFDVLEVLGGYSKEEANSNNLQTVRLAAEYAKGRKWPVAGVSDAHGCDSGKLFGWFYTLIFAESCEFEDLKESLLTGLSVAVKELVDECPEVYGEFRLVKYSDFLIREFYPAHDIACAREGENMLSVLAGDSQGIEHLKLFKGSVPEMFDKYWA